MKIMNLVVGIVVSGIILFLWSGLTQIFPWGVPSTNNIISSQSNQTKEIEASNLKRFTVNKFTTAEFDQEMVNKVNTLTTDMTFSWIVTKPLSYYNPIHYFMREVLTQFLIGFLLTIICLLTQPLPFKQRFLTVLFVGIITGISTYGQLFNWWGLTAIYALGVSANLLIGWAIAGFILIKFTIPCQKS